MPACAEGAIAEVPSQVAIRVETNIGVRQRLLRFGKVVEKRCPRRKGDSGAMAAYVNFMTDITPLRAQSQLLLEQISRSAISSHHWGSYCNYIVICLTYILYSGSLDETCSIATISIHDNIRDAGTFLLPIQLLFLRYTSLMGLCNLGCDRFIGSRSWGRPS